MISIRIGSIAASSMRTSTVFALRLLVQIALLFFLASYLGPTQYGEFAAVAAFALGLGTLSSGGLGFLVLRESAQSASRGTAMFKQAVGATLVSAGCLIPLYFWSCFRILESAASAQAIGLVALSELLLVPLLTLVTFFLQGREMVARSQIVGMLPMSFRLIGLLVCFVYNRNVSLIPMQSFTLAAP